jgi:hypothetical protein
MESELLFTQLTGDLSELRTENELYRWAERYIKPTSSPSLESKKLVSRLHKESSNISFIDDAQEDMIFACLYESYRRYEDNERPGRKRKRFEASKAEIEEMESAMRIFSELVYGWHRREQRCESSRVAVVKAGSEKENMSPPATRCQEVSSDLRRPKRNPLKSRNHHGSKMMQIYVQMNLPKRYKSLFRKIPEKILINAKPPHKIRVFIELRTI